MPRQGNGTYAPPAGQPVIPATTVASAVFNTLVADLGAEITRSISTDGQTPMAADFSMGGHRITSVALATQPSDAVRFDQLTDFTISTGASLIGFLQSGTGALTSTVQKKLEEAPSFGDRGASATGDATNSIQAALNIKKGSASDLFYSVSAPLRIASLSCLTGPRAGIAFTGNVPNAKWAIKKTTNTTAAITNFQSAVTTNQDCIAYIDPAWIDAGVSYPQKAVVERMALQGYPAAPNSHGIYIEQGGGFTFRELDISHVVNAIYAKEAWSSIVERVHALGKIVWLGGTSVTFTNCLLGAGPGSSGGFSFASLIYSTLNSCAVDGATDTAYRFVNSKLTLNSCGCENSSTNTANSGTAIAFDGGDEIVLNNFNVVPKVNQVQALYTVGFDSTITFNQGCAGFGVSGVNCPDLYVWGNNSTITFNDYTFWNGTKNSPVIQFAVGITTTKVIIRSGHTTKIYTSDGSGATLVEMVVDSGTFVPTLKFGGAATGMTYTVQTGTWQKNGKVVTVSGRIALSAKGSSVGIATLSGWPFAPLGDVLVNFAVETGVTGGPLVGTVDIGGNQAVLSARTATGDANATDTNFSNTSLLRFSATFTVA